MNNDDTELYEMLIDRLKRAGVSFDPALTDAEVAQIETAGKFHFPPDLRSFYQRGLPGRYARRSSGGARSNSRDFPDWRKNPEAIIARHKKQLWDGLRDAIFSSYDPDWNAGVYWPAAWEDRPATSAEALNILNNKWQHAPLLLPIWGHRYISTTPHEAGNPVFSIMGIDIIHYGYDLPDYLARDFRIDPLMPRPTHPRSIHFWDDFIS